jgi:hypothetical protein
MKTLALIPLFFLLQDPDPAKVDEWVRKLGDESIEVREAASTALIGFGEKVLPLLEKHEKEATGELGARLAAIRGRLTPTSLDALFKFAEEALKADSKLEEWQPKVMKQVKGILEILGDSIPAKRRERIRKAAAGTTGPGVPVVRKAAKDYDKSIVLLEKATGEDLKGNVLLICRSCEIEDFRDSVVICLGDIKTREMSDSLVIAKGDVESTREIDPSVLILGGKLISGDIEDSLILAQGGVQTGDSLRNVYLNGTKRTTKKTKGDTDVEKKEISLKPR